MPLARQRCVESPHPTSYESKNLRSFRGRRYPLIPRTFSLFTFTYYLERSETPLQGSRKAGERSSLLQYNRFICHFKRIEKAAAVWKLHPLPPDIFYLMLTLWFISQPVPKNRPIETRNWKITPVTPNERSFVDIAVPNENTSPSVPGETMMGT